MISIFFKWFWSVVFYHGWWRFNPKEWKKVRKKADRLTQKIPFDGLVKKNKKRGTPIHFQECEICNEKWYTTCKLPLCNRLSCWIKYARRK